jgi:hypothetical protein
MNPNHVLRRALCALAISSAVSFCAFAHESSYEETRIDVRTQAGSVETVLVGALAAGESKSITTIAGNPAQVTRTDKGLVLALAGEAFDIPLPQAHVVDADDLPAGAKVMLIDNRVAHAHAGEAGAKRQVIVRHGAGAKADAADLEAEMADPGPLADGQRVRVIRQVRREVTQ